MFARQKQFGVVPADAELTPRDDAFPAWDDVPPHLQALYARQMEVYAGFSENADHDVGRVLDAIEELGELDNTLVIWIWGDNGASLEGTITGSFNEMTMQNGIPLTDEVQLQLAERYGGAEAWGGRSWTRTTPQRGPGPATPRRDPQPDGDPLARPHRRPGRPALAEVGQVRVAAQLDPEP